MLCLTPISTHRIFCHDETLLCPHLWVWDSRLLCHPAHIPPEVDGPSTDPYAFDFGEVWVVRYAGDAQFLDVAIISESAIGILQPMVYPGAFFGYPRVHVNDVYSSAMVRVRNSATALSSCPMVSLYIS